MQLSRPMARSFRIGSQNEIESLSERKVELFQTAAAVTRERAAKIAAKKDLRARAIIDQMHIQRWRKAEIRVIVSAVYLVEFLNVLGEIDLFRCLRNLVDGDFHRR